MENYCEYCRKNALKRDRKTKYAVGTCQSCGSKVGLNADGTDPAELELDEEEKERLMAAYNEALEEQKEDLAAAAAEKAEAGEDEGGDGDGEKAENPERLDVEHFTSVMTMLCMEMSAEMSKKKHQMPRTQPRPSKPPTSIMVGRWTVTSSCSFSPSSNRTQVNGLGDSLAGQLWQAVLGKNKDRRGSTGKLDLSFRRKCDLLHHHRRRAATSTAPDALQEGMGEFFKDRVHRLNTPISADPKELEPEPEPEKEAGRKRPTRMRQGKNPSLKMARRANQKKEDDDDKAEMLMVTRELKTRKGEDDEEDEEEEIQTQPR